jgi:hypothetical protein
MTLLYGKLTGFCGYCNTKRDWFIKKDLVICASCGTRRYVTTPILDTIQAHCGYCKDDRDWVVSVKGNYICLGCGTGEINISKYFRLDNSYWEDTGFKMMASINNRIDSICLQQYL